MKNVAGYDLTRLFVGSLGTLGVITSLNVKVRPQTAQPNSPQSSAATIETHSGSSQRRRSRATSYRWRLRSPVPTLPVPPESTLSDARICSASVSLAKIRTSVTDTRVRSARFGTRSLSTGAHRLREPSSTMDRPYGSPARAPIGVDD